MLSPKLVSAEQFLELREHFARTGFNEKAIRERLEVNPKRELELPGLSSRPPARKQIADGLDAVIHLFVAGAPISEGDARAHVPERVWETLKEAGLVARYEKGENLWAATVALYPIRELFIASDRWSNPDHSLGGMFPDIVYPALTKSAKQFLNYTSFEPCEDFLELCAGSAPAALLAAREAKRVWATDIAERSLEFAKFNAALNGIENVTFGLGDMFEPVRGRKFDRIAAHPPYVPVLKPTEIFYGGGEVGEDLTRKVIEGLPEALKPGGRLYCRTLGTERPRQSFESRIRGWLGEKEKEFDVGLFVLQNLEPRQFALEETLNRNGGKEEFAQWEKMFTRNVVNEMVIGVVVIQRVERKRRAFTLRRTIGSGTTVKTLDWAMNWEREMQEEGALQNLLSARPIATPGIEILVRHVLEEGEIAPKNFTLSIEAPFATDCKVQPWMVMLLPKCDGKTSVAELFEAAKQNEWIVPETPAEEFARLLATLISGGFLQTEAFRLPAAAG